MPKRVVAALALALALAGLGGTHAAQALDEPKIPEQVSAYFASGLVPRLADLYGGIDFDATTKVGGIRRVLSWTGDFLAGKNTATPTELTNGWNAPVTINQTTVVGLATVWINPSNDLPELADFAAGPALAAALAAAPVGTLIVRDDAHSAWFATDGTTITPLVAGTSGVTFPTTPAKYQKTMGAPTPDAVAPNQGLLVAGIVLGIVVVILAVFILLPVRRRRHAAVEPPADVEDPAPIAVEPEPEPARPPVARPRAAAKPQARAKSATTVTAGNPDPPAPRRPPKVVGTPRKKPPTPSAESTE
ncbi:MAG: hypothetical protein JWN09_1382 [Microbacteriaceae bacterium]|nr:hypothetical protein [Microbacteriaceae bacterium]